MLHVCYCYHKATVDFTLEIGFCITCPSEQLSDNRDLFSRGQLSQMGLPHYGVTFNRLSHWDVWNSMFDNCTKTMENRQCLSRQQQTEACIYTWPLHPLPPILPLPSIASCNDKTLSYLFLIHPSVSALITGHWALDYFIFHSRVLQIELSLFSQLQTDVCYASKTSDFKELIA